MGCRAAAVEGGGEREEGEKEEYSAGHGFCCDLQEGIKEVAMLKISFARTQLRN